MSASEGIRWPDRFRPEVCPVHVVNELVMPVPPEAAWAWLIRAPLWPTWYRNAHRVRLQGSPGPDLSPGASFRWITFGVPIASTVREFVPGERIGWDGRAPGIDVYHAWIIERTPAGCRVLTEETQHGWLARLGHLVMPSRMGRMHQIWLEGLSRQAQAGSPLAA